MTNLKLTNNTETITSMEVAQMINKDHSKLLMDIHRYINQIEKINESKIGKSKIGFTDFFIESTYTTSQNKIQPCYNITHKGCEFIANKLTGIKGTEFTARYVNRFHELEENNVINSITTAMNTITQTLTTLTQTMTTMQQEIANIKENKNTNTIAQQKQLPKKKFSYWSTKMFPKYQPLTDYFNISNRELYKELFREFSNTYPDIDLNQLVDDYCQDNHLDTCFTLDAIEHNKDIRILYESMVDNLLQKYNLSDNISTTRYATIFDDNNTANTNKAL